MEKRKKLAIFDMDGTLFDTARTNFCAYEYACRKLGYSLDFNEFLDKFSGRNYKKFLPEMGINDFGDLEIIHEMKKEVYLNYLNESKINNHLFSIISDIRNEYIIALATTATLKNTEDILEYFKVRECFDLLVTQEDVKELKPNPECYYIAMSKAGVDVTNSLIFEDSEIGIKGALVTGATALRVQYF